MTRSVDADQGKEVKEVTNEHTEKRLVEEELKRVRAALNSAASGVIITDREGIIKYANPASYKGSAMLRGSSCMVLFT